MKCVSRAVSVALFFCFGLPLAQAQVGVYGMGSGAFLGSDRTVQSVVDNQGFNAYGFTVGLYDNFAHLGPVSLGGDARYFQGSSSNSNSYGNKLHGGTAGLRLAFHLPLIPIRPYIQAEVGGVGTNYGVQPNDSGSFAYQIQGGIDWALIPHLDVRAEYSGGQIGGYQSGPQQTLQQAGLGAVVRF